MLSIKKGFTLFELLIVLLIIAFAYTILVPKKKQNNIQPDIKNLKSYLAQFKGEAKRTLLCIDECKKCYVFVGDKKYKSDFFTENDLKAYKFQNGYLQQMNFVAPSRLDVYENICFKYNFDTQKNLGDEIFLETPKNVYYFPPYFSDVKVFKSLSEATDYYKAKLEGLRDKN